MKLAAATLLLGSYALLSAQTASVDLQRVLLTSQEGRAVAARLESTWRPRADAIGKRRSNIDTERAQFTQEMYRRRGWHFWRHVMTRKQKEAVAARLGAEQRAITREREDLRLDFDAQRVRVVNEMGRKVTAVAERYGRDHGLTLEYFDPEKRDHVWGPDITPEVISLDNQTHPVER